MLSFCWFSGQVLPVKRANTQGEEFLLLPESQERCATLEIHLGELSNWFATFVRQMGDLVIGQFWPPFPHGMCRSIYMLGACKQGWGVLRRPKFPFQREVVQELSRIAHAHGDQWLAQLPKFDFLTREEHQGFLHGQQNHLKQLLVDSWTRKMKRVQQSSSRLKNRTKDAGSIRLFLAI